MKLANAVLLLSMVIAQRSPAGIPQEQPEVIKRVTPAYPRIYLLAGKEGEVYVHATIDESGKVVKADVIKATDSGFGPAAIDAIKQWEFKPATLDGKPITTEVTIPIKFRLREAALPPGELVTLREQITTFLEKGTSTALRGGVDSSAYVISGGNYDLLLGILSDKNRSRILSKGGEQIQFFHLKADAASDAAFMTVKTSAGKSTRFHSIVALKGDNGAWKIVSWHVSS